MSLRSVLATNLSPKNKIRLQSLILNTERVLKGKKRYETILKYQTIGDPSKNCFFGYYDISPFNSRGDILFHQLDEKLCEADIMLYKRSAKDFRQIASSKAWNWQQGTRLRWFPNSDENIVFNDFKDGVYIARIINVDTFEEYKICKPLYDIDHMGRYGLSLDFERLGTKRPGYGYTCKPYIERTDLVSEGIDLVDLNTNTFNHIVSYSDIAKILDKDSCDFRNNYINHLSFSPSGNKFMFFWLTIDNGYHNACMLIYDINLEKLIPLETKNKVSHYLWLDDESILCTVYDEKQNCRYVIYGLDGIKRHVLKKINYDGHPILYKNGLILTDSYPDKNGYQKLLKCSLDTEEIDLLLEIFQEPAITGERRTDLHPRYDKATDTICIDSNPKGIREMLLLTNNN